MATITDTQIRGMVIPRTGALRFGLGVAISALSGVMLLLAFPPYEIWWLAWIALVPGIFAQHRLFPRKWSSLGPAIAHLFWLGPFLARLFGPEFGPFLQYLGVWIAILIFFFWKDRKFHELTGYRWFVLQGISNWVGFEMVRATFIPMIATTAFIGYTQATQPWLIQPISVFSVFGLNMFIVLVNYALAQVAMGWFDRKWQLAATVRVDGRVTRLCLAVTAAVGVAWTSLSLTILNSAPADMPKVRVAALRPNLPLPAFQDEAATSEVRFNIFAQQAREAAQQGAQVLYTPEMMFNFDPQAEYSEQFRALAKKTGAFIFITYTVAQEGEDWRNEAVLLTPEGKFLDIYGKNHAFGEPPTVMRGVYPVYNTPLGRLASMICHDANYTDVARRLAANGAQIIAAPIREFGGFGEQYWNNALFRAVENRTAVVVTGVATISAIINPDGSLVALDADPEGSRVTLVGDVTLGSNHAPYTSLGDVLGWACLAGLVFFTVFQSVIEWRIQKGSANQSPADI